LIINKNTQIRVGELNSILPIENTYKEFTTITDWRPALGGILGFHCIHFTTVHVMRLSVIDYILSMFVIAGNTMIIYILTRMKNTKKTTNILFGQLAFSNFILGLAHFTRTLCTSLELASTIGCHVLRILLKTSSLMYTTILLFIYIALYISTKRINIHKEVFSRKGVICLILLSWTFWLIIISLGPIMVSGAPQNTSTPFALCQYSDSTQKRSYVTLVFTIWTSVIVALLTFHILTYRLINTSYKSSLLMGRGLVLAGQTTEHVRQAIARSRWSKTQKEHLTLLVTIMLVLSISWGLCILFYVLMALCDDCRVVFSNELNVIGKVLFTIPLFSNGAIYISRCRGFKVAFCSIRRPRPVEVHPM
jgi:hypothetical protein